MREAFKTVRGYGEAEEVIRKSRFIGQAQSVSDEREALAFIEDVRSRHSSATHHCYAYRAGDGDRFQKQSDDGEPSGTAGRPMMEVIRQRELSNIAVVVTRYFGGQMLGAGGLIRAYAGAAAAGIDAASPVWKVLHREMLVEIDYTWLGKLENELRHRRMTTGETRFADKVTLVCFPKSAEVDDFVRWMEDLTQGQARIRGGKETYMEHDAFPDM